MAGRHAASGYWRRYLGAALGVGLVAALLVAAGVGALELRRPAHAARPGAGSRATGKVGGSAGTAGTAGCPVGVDSLVSAADPSTPDGRRQVWVHRPSGPDQATIPVVYALHGYPAAPAGLATGSLPALLDQAMCRTGHPFVLAVPDGRAGALDTEWGDDAEGRFAIESFVTGTAVELVEGAAPRPASLRAVIGFSMGGFGAAALALRHPDRYAQVACFGGYFHLDDPDGVFAGESGTHAPDQLASAGKGQRYFLVEGTDDHDTLMSGTIHGEADRFAAILHDHGVLVAVTHPTGGHSEDTWFPELGPMVDFLDAGWHPTPGTPG